MTSRFASLTEQDMKKVVEDKDSQTQKGRRRWKRSCLLITWKRKNWENLRKRKSWHAQTLKTCYVEERKKGFVQCIIKQLLDSVFNNNLITPTSTLIILDITKTSSNNCLKFVCITSRCRYIVLSLHGWFTINNNGLKTKSFVIPRVSLYRASLYRGRTV